MAAAARVSIRTLHHYDDIGLLRPSGRTDGNYRVYTAPDLSRLHQIRLYRELGFALHDIAALLDDPHFDPVAALKEQRALLQERREQLGTMLAAIDTLIQTTTGGKTMSDMTKNEIKELFDGFDPGEHEAEAQERWGDTDAYKQSMARTKRYTKADWDAIKAEVASINARYLALKEAGTPPDSAPAQAVAAEHHAHQCRWFYDSSPAMFASVSELWVNDPRFTHTIDKAGAGLAAYQYAVVQAWLRSTQQAAEQS